MSRTRSTVEVVALKAKINERLATCENIEVRKELCSLIESVLFAANAYGGFMYIGGWQGIETYRHRYL